MATITVPKKAKAIDSFEVNGERFVILKKDFLDKLLIFHKEREIFSGLQKMKKLDQNLEKALKDVKKWQTFRAV